MNRIIQILALLTITVWPGLSGAYMEVLARSYELSLDDVTLPAHTAGQVVVKPCAECAQVTHPVNDDTVYRIDQSAVPLATFLAAVNDGLGRMILVAVDPNTAAVVRITLDTDV